MSCTAAFVSFPGEDSLSQGALSWGDVRASTKTSDAKVLSQRVRGWHGRLGHMKIMKRNSKSSERDKQNI